MDDQQKFDYWSRELDRVMERFAFYEKSGIDDDEYKVMLENHFDYVRKNLIELERSLKND